MAEGALVPVFDGRRAASSGLGGLGAVSGMQMLKAGPVRAQKTTQTEGSHILVPRPNTRGIPEIMACRMLMFMWSFGALPVKCVSPFDASKMSGPASRERTAWDHENTVRQVLGGPG